MLTATEARERAGEVRRRRLAADLAAAEEARRDKLRAGAEGVLNRIVSAVELAIAGGDTIAAVPLRRTVEWLQWSDPGHTYTLADTDDTVRAAVEMLNAGAGPDGYRVEVGFEDGWIDADGVPHRPELFLIVTW